jgi:hypothetical protein
MSISPPIGLIITAARWVSGLVTKKLFMSTYHRSHELWAKRQRLGSHWKSCGDHLEYSLYLAQLTDPEPRISKIAIRTTGGDIARLALTFEAESDVARFQEQVTMVNVNRKAIVWTMTNIPYQRFVELHEHVGPRFSWDAYRMRDVRIKLQSGEDVAPFDTMTSHLTHTWFLNSEWELKWHRFWNLDAVQWAKHRIAQYWRFRFGMPAVRIYGPSDSSANTITRRQVLVVITRPIAWLMMNKHTIAIQFWFALWSGLCMLNDESQLQWRWNWRKETLVGP